MEITLKPATKSRVTLTISVPAELVQESRQEAIQKVSQQIKIPGFRPGKATEEVILNNLGEKPIMDETIDLVIQKTYGAAVTEKDIKVVSRPEKVELISFEPFKYTITVAVYPEIKLKNYKKLKIPKEEVSVTQKEIDDVVADLTKRFAEYKPVERAARMKDKVTIDFEGKDDQGVMLDGTSSKNHPVILGEGNFIPGFEEEIVGLKAGEDKTFEITFPADYRAVHLANKKVVFYIKAHSVEEVHMPELTEEFIEKMRGSKMTKEAFLKTIKEGLEKEKTESQKHKRENELLEKLITVADLEVPDALIEEELEAMLDEYASNLQRQGIPFDKYLEYSKKSVDDLKKDWTKDAHDRVAVRFILQAILEKEEITAPEEEVEKEIDTIVGFYPAEQQEEIRNRYATDTRERSQLAHRLKITKLVNSLLDQ